MPPLPIGASSDEVELLDVLAAEGELPLTVALAFTDDVAEPLEPDPQAVKDIANTTAVRAPTPQWGKAERNMVMMAFHIVIEAAPSANPT